MPGKVKCCLLVEDDPEDQEFFIDVLHNISSKAGCYAVSNGEEALFTLLHENLMPDYIFTDINMPRMGGLEFLKILKGIDKFRNIPVVVYTADYNEEQINNVRSLGAVAIYSKTSPAALKSILKKYFEEASDFTTVL